jgi:hypothetical protein
LTRFLVRFGLINHQARAAPTDVALAESLVVGGDSRAAGAVADEGSSDRLSEDLARHRIPIMLFARLAVSLAWQGRGLGPGLLGRSHTPCPTSTSRLTMRQWHRMAAVRKIGRCQGPCGG